MNLAGSYRSSVITQGNLIKFGLVWPDLTNNFVLNGSKGLTMEPEVDQRKFIVKKGNPIQFGIVNFVLTTTMVIEDISSLKMELVGGYRNSVIKECKSSETRVFKLNLVSFIWLKVLTQNVKHLTPKWESELALNGMRVTKYVILLTLRPSAPRRILLYYSSQNRGNYMK